MGGDRKIAAVGVITPSQTTAERPALARPAPSSPPMRAWLLLVGMPSTHVITFQLIAPISAPKMTVASMMLASPMPLPTVSATWRPKKRKAMKLKNAAQATATCGRTTRVDTPAAIELAAECRPERRSKNTDERRVGQGGVITVRSWWWPLYTKKK